MASLGLEPKSSAGNVIRCLRGLPHPFTYTACYCEENVHLLVPALVQLGFAPSLDRLFAVFISNPCKQVPLWKQRAGLARKRRRHSRHRRSSSKGTGQESSGSDGDGGSGTGSGGNGDEHEDEDGAEEREEEDGEEEDGTSSDGCSSGEESDGDGDEGLVVWDYHVVLLQVPGPGSADAAGLAAPADYGQGHAAAAAADSAAVAAAVGGCPQPGHGAGGCGAAAAMVPEGGGDSKRGTAGAAAGVVVAPGAGDGAGPADGGDGGPGGSLVWDLDTSLPFPCSLEVYAKRALKSHYRLAEQHRRFFRVVPAASYLRHFASDRSHMRRPGGGWSAPPPPYPPLVAADGTTNNIQRFWDMTATVSRSTEVATVTVAATAAAAAAGPELQGRQPALVIGAGSDADAMDRAGALERMMASAGPYGVVLDEQSFLSAFGVDGGWDSWNNGSSARDA